jgi:hypothetical protein
VMSARLVGRTLPVEKIPRHQSIDVNLAVLRSFVVTDPMTSCDVRTWGSADCADRHGSNGELTGWRLDFVFPTVM